MPWPRKGESKRKYISRCIKYRQSVEKKNESVKQSAAICYSMWRIAKKEARKKG